MDILTARKLNNGVDMPMLGLGVFQSSVGEETVQAVQWALESGYRHIDTATAYRNEDSVAEGIKRSGIKREDIFITTKLNNPDQRADAQEQAILNSLKNLRTDYIDLYLIHWPVAGKYVQSWQIMEKYYKKGAIRAIGLSNFHDHHIDDILAIADILPTVDQIELHPRLTQVALRAKCDAHDIAVEAWSPLGGGGTQLVYNETLSAIGEKYNKSGAQVILRWDLQSRIITIPKSVHKERIAQNADIFDFELTAQDMAAIDALNENTRVGADPENFNF